jgi:hypothetical protein
MDMRRIPQFCVTRKEDSSGMSSSKVRFQVFISSTKVFILILDSLQKFSQDIHVTLYTPKKKRPNPSTMVARSLKTEHTQQKMRLITYEMHVTKNQIVIGEAPALRK